jgi:tetratricopeptide (TPR) repeat protein
MSEEKHIKKVKQFLKEKKYDLALKYSDDLEKEKIALLNYLKGIILLDSGYPKKSKEKAEQHFIKACECENTIEDSFIQLSYLKKQPNKVKKILRRGIAKFPFSIELYEALTLECRGKELEALFKEIKMKKIESFGIYLRLLDNCMDNNKYHEAIELIKQIKINKKYIFERMILKTVHAFAYYEDGKITESKELFEQLYLEDIGNKLYYAPYFGLILCLLGKQNDRAIEILRGIPEDLDFTIPPPLPLYIGFNNKIYFSFFFDSYILKAINPLEKHTTHKRTLGIIRGIRGLNHFGKASNKKIIKDLEYANRVFPSNEKFSERLSEIAVSKGRYYDAYEYLIKYIINNQFSGNIERINFDFFDCCNKEDIKKIASDFIVKLNEILFDVKEKIIGNLFIPLVEVLFHFEEPKLITDLCDRLNGYEIENSEIIFKIAYSYYETRNIDKAEIFYKKHLKMDKDNNATLNNLALIYKEKGEVKKAFLLVKKGISLYPEDEYLKNQYNDLYNFFSQSKDFDNENIYIKNKLLSFYNNRDNNGNIICSYKSLPKFLNVLKERASGLLKIFLDKGYICKITKHKLDTQSSVYRINPFLEENITKYARKCSKEKKNLEIAQRINIDYIESLGLNAELIKKLGKVSNNDLRKIVKRDLSENVFAIITESYKASLVLSGSIIETLLLYKITDKGIKKYKLPNTNKNKQVISMGLSELLDVAKTEDLIESQTYHISHFIRNYRNLIHPGVEQRKKAIEASKRNALRAWEFLIDIIKEILT